MRKDVRNNTNQPVYSMRLFVNKLTNETIENYFSNETQEIDGVVFWKTINKKGRVALLAKDSWTLQNKKNY